MRTVKIEDLNVVETVSPTDEVLALSNNSLVRTPVGQFSPLSPLDNCTSCVQTFATQDLPNAPQVGTLAFDTTRDRLVYYKTSGWHFVGDDSPCDGHSTSSPSSSLSSSSGSSISSSSVSISSSPSSSSSSLSSSSGSSISSSSVSISSSPSSSLSSSSGSSISSSSFSISSSPSSSSPPIFNDATTVTINNGPNELYIDFAEGHPYTQLVVNTSNTGTGVVTSGSVITIYAMNLNQMKVALDADTPPHVSYTLKAGTNLAALVGGIAYNLQ